MDDPLARAFGDGAPARKVAVNLHFRSRLFLRLVCFLALLAFLEALSIVAGFLAAQPHHTWNRWANPASENAASSLRPAAIASPSREAGTKDSDAEELNQLAPQQQAERLLELAIRRPDPSLSLIHKNLDSWRGHLENSDRLFHLVLEALKADDPRVRSAAVEIDLAANHLEKTSRSLARLVHQIRSGNDGRFLALWRLGALGNQGVEPGRVLSILLRYSRDANQKMRLWAVEGLAMLGTEETIDPLLDIMAHDPAAKVRQSAAFGLGQSGLLTGEQRLMAVPQLLNLLDDDSLDSSIEDLVYSTLESITGASLGKNANAWRDWWAHHDRPEKTRFIPKGLLVA